jgi:hypothetical protein
MIAYCFHHLPQYSPSLSSPKPTLRGGVHLVNIRLVGAALTNLQAMTVQDFAIGNEKVEVTKQAWMKIGRT